VSQLNQRLQSRVKVVGRQVLNEHCLPTQQSLFQCQKELGRPAEVSVCVQVCACKPIHMMILVLGHIPVQCQSTYSISISIFLIKYVLFLLNIAITTANCN